MPSKRAPLNWSWIALTQVARLESGHTPSRRHPEYWGGNIPWLSIQDAKAHHCGRVRDTHESTNELGIANSSARVLPKNTVCLSRTASVGYTVILDQPMATSQDFVNWVCSDQLDPEFLKYLFVAEGKQILRYASGAVHQTIYFPEAKAFHICYPPLTEQHRIVRILDEAFSAIAKAKANTESSLSWVGALPESRLRTILDRRGPDWQDRTLREVAENISTGPFGTMLHKSDYVPNGIPLVNPMNLIQSRILPSKAMMVNATTRDRLRVYELKPGDVVVARRGELGRCAVVTDKEAGWLCGTGCFVVRLSKYMNPRFFVALFDSAQFRRILQAVSVGATMSNLNHSTLNNLVFPVPPIAEQEQIVERLGELRYQLEQAQSAYQRKLTALDQLKESLLHQAFSGNL
jgi:type I restriction enzyme, S subunit